MQVSYTGDAKCCKVCGLAIPLSWDWHCNAFQVRPWHEILRKDEIVLGVPYVTPSVTVPVE